MERRSSQSRWSIACYEMYHMLYGGKEALLDGAEVEYANQPWQLEVPRKKHSTLCYPVTYNCIRASSEVHVHRELTQEGPVRNSIPSSLFQSSHARIHI